MTPRITIETTTGTIGPKPPDDLTLEDVLALRRLPGNLFQAYISTEPGQQRPVPIDTPVSALSPNAEVTLRCIMNPNFSEFLEILVTRHTRDEAVTLLQDIDFGTEGCEKIVYELDAKVALELVADKVRSFVAEHSHAGQVLAGVSGGGDSNALIGALAAASEERGAHLVAFTLICDPIWPETSAERAAAICHAHGVEHLLIDGSEMMRVLRMKTDVPTFYAAFLARYGRNTAHFFGTYMISAIARRLCEEHGTSEYCLGFNREDVLAEVLFSVLNGRRPLEYPVRRFGDKRLLMPVWEIPKLVLDACYPDYSKQNYEDRIDTTPQRGLIYFLSHAIEGIYPNLGLSLMRGLRDMLADNWGQLRHNEEFDLYIEELVESNDVAATNAFLAEHLRAGRRG